MQPTIDSPIALLDLPTGHRLDRDPRVRFKHPVRVVPIGGPPRAYRGLANNLSRDGMSLRMPTPLDKGTKVALSLEAGGRVLPFAQAEVVWRDLEETKQPGRGSGFGVRFTGFLHPRAHELVDYLVENLETGKPLKAPGAPPAWRKRVQWIAAGLSAVIAGAVITFGALTLFKSEPPIQEQPIAVSPEAVAAVPVAVSEPVPLPVPVPEPESTVVQAEPSAPVVTVRPKSKSTPIPTGAAKSITAALDSDHLTVILTLAPGSELTRAFTLRNPDRLAIDLRGQSPRQSHVLQATGELRKIRVGKIANGTRVVLDLVRLPGAPVVVSGNQVSLPLK